jgi:predicted GTPase
VPEIRAVFHGYPHIGKVLPAVGYGPAQLQALAATVNASSAEIVVSATPIDLARLVPINKPIVRVRHEYAEVETPSLSTFVDDFPSVSPANKRGKIYVANRLDRALIQRNAP